MRRISTTGRDLPKDTHVVCQKWLDEWLIKFRVTLDRNASLIHNMDQTSIYLDFPAVYTYEKKGCRRVKAITAGGERTRLSAAFPASASGQKSKTYIIVPRVNPLDNFEPPDNVLISYQTGIHGFLAKSILLQDMVI